MFAVCCSSFLFIISSSCFGMPISGTHTVIGALLGAGMVGIGFYQLNWQKLGMIVLSWIISPAIAAVFSFVLMNLSLLLTVDLRNKSFRFRMYAL